MGTFGIFFTNASIYGIPESIPLLFLYGVLIKEAISIVELTETSNMRKDSSVQKVELSIQSTSKNQEVKV